MRVLQRKQTDHGRHRLFYSLRKMVRFCTVYRMFKKKKVTPFQVLDLRPEKGLLSGGTFGYLMELVLRGLTWKTCLVYIDEIIIIVKNVEEHLYNLRDQECTPATHRQEMCSISVEGKIGHVRSSEWITTDPEKYKTVVE